MPEQSGERIKVILRWVQILDNLEPAMEEKGEFRFTARVTGPDGVQETRFPEEGHYSISDHPAWNKLTIQSPIYEGEAGDRLDIELLGEEIDLLSANDDLTPYRRSFRGPVEEWLGWYGPGDEHTDDVKDPENLDNWRVCYEIVKA